MQKMVTLTIMNGILAGARFEFTDSVTGIIGRTEECVIRLPSDLDQKVSRRHCELSIGFDEILVLDLKSRNGTFVNGCRLASVDHRQEHKILKHGDLLQVGETSFQVELGGVELLQSRRHDKGCVDCGADIKKEFGIYAKGDLLCDNCRDKARLIMRRCFPNPNISESSLAKRFIAEYQLIKPLGKGGMGEVFLARRGDGGPLLALKVMSPTVYGDKAKMDFHREFRNMQNLRHENIVQLFDFGHDKGHDFYVMEYCELGNLDQWLKRRDGLLTLEQALPITKQLLAALDYASEVALISMALSENVESKSKGLVHRDIKPENIFLTGDERAPTAKLADFGLSKAYNLAGRSGYTMTGDIKGTPVFMCRQMALDFKYSGPEVDVWSVATCLYYMLTGDFPRDFNDEEGLLDAVLSQNPVPIRQRWPEIPQKIALVIDQALDDTERLYYRSAKEFSEDLQAANGF